MASVLAIRAVLGASLGLGALDLVWINAALAPRLVQPEYAPAPAGTRTGPSAAVPDEQPPVRLARDEEHAAALPAHDDEHAAALPAHDPHAATPPVIGGDDADDTTAPSTMRVYFATSSAVLDTSAQGVLAKLSARAQPRAMFVLEGHADYRGDEKRNRWLSRDRAVAVRQQLVRLGIDAARVRIGYVGEGEATTELWRDRRVDIQITGGTR